MKRAFTRIELLVVVIVIGVLLGVVMLPSPKKPRRHYHGPACISNLKNVGLAFRIFATDNGDKFPMAVSTNQGGTKEFPDDPDMVYRHFQALSNELSTPKILICPQDASPWIKEATEFTATTRVRGAIPFNGNDQISYFLGLNADETMPTSILSGDNNIMTPDRPDHRVSWISTVPSGQEIDTYSQIEWTVERHEKKGNIGFGDGSVRQVTSEELRQLFKDAPLDTKLGIPGGEN